MRKQKVTIQDVAKEANVSIASVSRALNKPDSVKEETLQAILDTVTKLGYEYKKKRSTFTSSFVSSETTYTLSKKSILINIPEMSNPFYAKIIAGIHASAKSKLTSVIFSSESITDSNVEDFINLVKQLHVIGIILLNAIPPLSLNKIANNVPVVQCCEYYSNPYASYVGIDDYAATQLAMDHFFSMGLQKIGFINGPIEFNYSKNRLAAYKSIMASAGIDIPHSWIIQLPELSHDLAFTSVVQLLSSPNPPDCFFAVSDSLAAAAIKAVQYCDLKVPDDILVIGFDNTDISQLSTPSISTIRQPRYQLGFLAAELLFEKIENPLSELKRITLPTALVLRESTMRELSGKMVSN